jgi:O-methyltransferase involved in polyketide biosynthesis
MTKTKVDLGVIQETLLIPLWVKAAELQRVGPIICDPKSTERLETIDYDFDKFATEKNSQIGSCLRGMILIGYALTSSSIHKIQLSRLVLD